MPQITMPRTYQARSNRLRTVRSHGVMPPSRKFIGVPSECLATAESPACAASKFSHEAQLGQYTIRRSTGKLPSLATEDSDSNSDTEPIEPETSEAQPDVNMVISLLKQSGRGKVGYLSLFMLVMFFFSNFALEIVDAQISHLAPELYDNSPRRSSSLGTAAISSVTEALSPILPFTGGVDLRREEHWDTSNGWFQTATSMVNQVRDAFGLEPMPKTYWSMVPRGGGQSSSSGTKVHVKPKSKPQAHVSTLSAATPFVSIDTIAGMTLGDLSAAFQFAVESTRPGFNEKRFLDSIHGRMRPIVMGLKNAASKSRGIDVEPALTVTPSSKYESPDLGNFDALTFCGAMRLFAEWRVVRQVPDGYKGFAVGMNLGQKDIVQNVAKIEKAVHEWIEYRRDLLTLQSQWDSPDAMEDTCPDVTDKAKDCTLRSPTLRQLLEHELDMEVHDANRLPRLKDKTAAMGLLWVRRQLHYQTELFSNILQVPTKFTTANTAVTAAYNEVYGKFHGWAVQKIFTYSFQAAPEVDVIYRYMNPHQLKVVSSQKGTTKGMSVVKSFDDDFSDNDEEENLNPFQKFGNHVIGIWENVVNAFADDSMKLDLSSDSTNDEGDFEEFVTREMTDNAHKHITLYLDVVQPVLGDIAGLFDELNMNDPSKV